MYRYRYICRNIIENLKKNCFITHAPKVTFSSFRREFFRLRIKVFSTLRNWRKINGIANIDTYTKHDERFIWYVKYLVGVFPPHRSYGGVASKLPRALLWNDLLLYFQTPAATKEQSSDAGIICRGFNNTLTRCHVFARKWNRPSYSYSTWTHGECGLTIVCGAPAPLHVGRHRHYDERLVHSCFLSRPNI